MTGRDRGRQARLPATEDVDGPLVVRSDVAGGMQYYEYKEHLRYDFFYSCAYCSMTEAEAQAIRFVIDHYEPRRARPDLEHVYINLMYSCDSCNLLKGDRCPPDAARNDGHRFFRPDQDVHSDHFEIKGIRLEAKTNMGSYSIEALDLNRAALLKLRGIRGRLANRAPLVAQGVLALRKFQLDQLPPNMRGLALSAIKKAEAAAEQFANDIDTLLRAYARSNLIDPDPDAEIRREERLVKLAKTHALYPGSWRAPRAAHRK